MANNQRFTLTFDANLNVSQMKGALSQISGQMSKLQLPPNITKNLTTGISNLEKELRNFEVLASKDITNKSDFKALEKSAEKISSLYRNLQIQVKDIANTSDAKKLFPPDVTNNIKKAVSAVEKYEKTMADASKQAINLQKRINSWTAKATIASEDKKVAQGNLSTIQDAAKLKQIFKKVGSDISAIGDPKAIDAAIASLDELIKKAEEYNNKVQNEKNSRGKDYANSTKARAQAQLDALKQLKTAYDSEASSLKTAMDALDKATKERDKAAKTIRELNVQLQNANAVKGQAQQSAITQLFQDLSQLNGIDLSKYQQTLDGARQAISDYERQVAEGVRDAADVVVQGMDKSESAFEKNRREIQETARSWSDFEDRMREVDSLKSRIQYFFGLNNAIELFKRTIRSAFNTVKELDAAMTETAVVTDFTVADMWAQLPDYTKRANDLGVTTKAAYEAATLYYQQGLKTNEVTAMSNETLKMARIAGLDAAVATDRMTNAIRGFNMEINEMNAQRIDDVYSKLAAISASNVDEISTAMTKVASLANNANMEFETTSAFLAQIIETTRESAETAGTALKTVVARFSEVKKLVSEDQLKGQDEEGQLIDVNKVSEALRTAGVDLNKYFLGEVGLDDIFMELASKWDSLTTLQQRYIATQAAGSRQQSRFIALMSDYGRMQELVGEAYNANGAAAEQFGKTQDSLQSKLARLKNAWNEFAMGLANNSLIKLGVDALTHILNIVNGLTSGFEKLLGPSGSFIDGLTKIALLIGGLKVGKGLLAGSLSSIIGKGSFGKAAASAMGVEPGKGVFGTLGKGFISPFKNIGASFSLFKETDLAKNIWGGAKGLGGKVLGGITGLGPGLGIGEVSALEGVVGLTTAIGGITVAAGAAYAAIKKLYDLSPTGQVKIAEKYAATISKVANEAKKSEASLKDAQEKYKEYSQAISDSSNVQDHSKAIQDRNDYLTSLLEQDASFAEYLQSEIQNGELVLSIDEEAFANAIAKAEEAVQESKVSDLLAQANLSAQKADLAATMAAVSRDISYNENGDIISSKDTTASLRYKSQQQASTFQAQSFAQQAALEMLGDANLGDELTKTLANSYATAFDADKYQKDASGRNWFARTLDHAGIKREYEAIYGLGSSKDLTYKEMDQAVQASKAAEDEQAKIDELIDYLKKDTTGKYEDILKAYSGDFSNFSSLISQGELNLDLDSEALNNVADSLGLTIDQLTTQIQNYAQTERERQLQTRDTGYYSLAKGGTSKLDIARYLTLDNFEDMELISGLAQKFESSGVGGEIAHSILDQIESGTFEDSDLQKWLEDLNFDSPIAGAKALHDGLQSVNPQVRELAEAIQANDEAMSQFSASAQLSYLMTSEGAEQLNKSLDDFIEENGAINSSNIIQLADSSAELNSLLETGAFSAKGLATALNGISLGLFNFYDLNDAIIAAFNSMDDLDGIVSSTIEDLNNFDPGYDENDITGFINTAYENAIENFDKGAYGNNQMANYMREIFGAFTPEEGQDYGESYKTWLQDNISWLEANKENMYSAWSDVAASWQNGQQEFADIIDTGSEIIINLNGQNTQDLIQSLQENAHLTETQAKMLIADYKNYSADFAHELAVNDSSKAIDTFMAENRKHINDQALYTEQELDTLAKGLGLSVAEVKKQIIEKSGGVKSSKFQFLDIDTKDINSVKAALKKVSNVVGDYANEDGIVNATNLKRGMGILGIDEEFDNTLNQMVGNAKKFQWDFGDGNLVNVAIAEGQTAGEALASAMEAKAQEQFGANFFSGVVAAAAENNINIEAIDIPLNIKADDVETQLSTIIDKQKTINSTRATASVGVIGASNATREINNLQTALNNLKGTRNTTISITASGAGGLVIDKPGGGKSPPGSGGWRGVTKAKGGHTSPGIALTGEEDPEIIWNKEQGYAYITGNEGPEFQNLQAGDRVFNAQETKKILKRSKQSGVFSSFASGKYPSYASAYGNTTKFVPISGTGSSSKTSTKTSSNSEKSSEEWKNELDWLYNLMEDIAESERTQEQLATQHERYLKDSSKTGKDLYNITKQQMKNLNQQYAYQTQALRGREKEMQEQINQSGYTKYVKWNNKDRTIEIDWDKIEKIQNKDTYDKVSELVSKAEDIQGKIDAAEDAIEDIKDQMKELQERYVQEYIDFQQRVLDAVVNKYQENIDNLNELNDTINESNTNILNSIRDEIDLQRQIRDNTDTENEISDMEARLAYLRRDTTGANQNEILQLEKQLEDTRESYSDTLIDQSIDRLADANDKAAEQREHQIQILTAQLEYWQKNGDLWPEVAKLMKDGLSSKGYILFGSDLMSVLKNAEGFQGMSPEQQKQWTEQLEEDISPVNAYSLSKKHPVWDNATDYMAIMQSLLQQRGSQALLEPAYQDAAAARIEKRIAQGATHEQAKKEQQATEDKYLDYMVIMQSLLKQYGEKALSRTDYKQAAAARIEKRIAQGATRKQALQEQRENENKYLKKKTRYATGGLNTSTGLAWLDGTTKEPEYVLNARQTEAFLRLSEVLPSIFSNGTNYSNTIGGNVYLELTMNVGEIGSDYDVDRLVERVKSDIYETSAYRNVNIVNRSR